MKPKTHRGVAKRFRVTRTGKVVHRKSNMNHNFKKKSSSRKRRLSRTGRLGVDKGEILRLLRRR